MEHIPLVLQGVKYGTNNYTNVRDPIKRHMAFRNRDRSPDDPVCRDVRTMEERGFVLKKRSEVASDEEVVEVVRHKGQILSRRPRMERRPSSLEGDEIRRSKEKNNEQLSRGRGRGGVVGAGRDASDSEGSVPPKQRRAKSAAGSGRGGRKKRGGSSSSSDSSSDLGSSTDENKKIKKIHRQKWITGGLAAVATIHAVAKVYSSVENHDKRLIQVHEGKLSPEEAHDKARKARWQDAAAIGIAALGIKGAISEWKEVREEHEKHLEMCEQHEEQHRKRLEHERRKRARATTGYYKGRDGNWYYDGKLPQDSEQGRQDRMERSQKYRDQQVDGPRAGERKLIEAPSSFRSQSRGRPWENSRSDSPSPVRAKSRADGNRDRRQPSPDQSRSKSRSPSSSSRPPYKNPLVIAALAAPILAGSTYILTQKDLKQEPILPTSDAKRRMYLKQRTETHKETTRDLITDTIEEALDHV